MDLKDELLRRLPQMAVMAMAAKQGGLPAASGFMGGMQHGQLRQQQLDRQAMQDQRAQEMHTAQMANLDADNARQLKAMQHQQFERALAAIERAYANQSETATDPGAADAAMQAAAKAAAGGFGVPVEQLTPFVRNVAPVIQKGVKADIAKLLDDSARAAQRMGQTYDDSTVSFTWDTISPRLQKTLVSMGHPEGQPVKPSQIQHIQGIAVTPAPPKPANRNLQSKEMMRGGRRAVVNFEPDTGKYFDLQGNEVTDIAPIPPAARGGLTPTQQLTVLRDRAYSQILEGDRMSDSLAQQMIAAGLDPAAEERKARKAYATDLAQIERGLRPPQDRYGLPEDPADVEARRGRARDLLRRSGRGMGSGPRGGGAGSSPSTGNTITLAEVRAAAQKRGTTEQDAIEAYRSRGFLIVE